MKKTRRVMAYIKEVLAFPAPALKGLVVHFALTSLAVFLITRNTPTQETWISFVSAVFLAFFDPF